MKNFSLSIFLFLLFGIHDSFGQASWTYDLSFNLYDKDGAIISTKEFEEEKITLYTMPLGAHSDNVLKYDTLNQFFVFSQHTIAGRSMVILVAKNDTAVFEIPTHPGQIAKLELINGTFERRLVRVVGGLIEFETIARLGHPDLSKLTYYDPTSGEFREMTFSDLKKVELE